MVRRNILLTHSSLCSSQIAAVLGYADSEYIVDQLALHPSPSEPLRS
jgi:hypothetical protein